MQKEEGTRQKDAWRVSINYQCIIGGGKYGYYRGKRRGIWLLDQNITPVLGTAIWELHDLLSTFLGSEKTFFDYFQ
jgi:hypothetical protein